MGYQLKNQYKGNKYALFVAFVVLAFLIFLGFFSNAYADSANDKKTFGSVSLGVVDVTYLMEHAPQAEIASNMLKRKFQPQEKALAKVLEEIQVLEAGLEKGAQSLTVSERRQKERELRSKKRSRSRALQDFREELRFARDSALDDVQKEVFQAIDTVRQRLRIDIILQDYVSASKRIDITQSVLAHLKQKLINTKEFNQLGK